MVASVVIIVLSVAMFVYWFRYSCVLILESDWNEEQARQVAHQNALSFGALEETLTRFDSAQDMDRAKDLLERDLHKLSGLMARCESLQAAGQSMESRLLIVDFQIMRAWYAVTRSSAAPKAQAALREMYRIVAYMAGEFGDHLATARS